MCLKYWILIDIVYIIFSFVCLDCIALYYCFVRCGIVCLGVVCLFVVFGWCCGFYCICVRTVRLLCLWCFLCEYCFYSYIRCLLSWVLVVSRVW